MVNDSDAYIILKINNKCNNLCNFCADDWQVRTLPEKSLEEIQSEILDGIKNGFKRLIITGGEPTISKNLFKTIRFARQKGIEHISIVTNARLLSNDVFFNKINSEIDRFLVSFFAANPETFDKISGVKGAFKQAFKGMQNISKSGKVVNINAVITKDNYTELNQLLLLLIALNSNHVQFAFPNPTGFALRNNVFVRYKDLTDKIIELIELSQYMGYAHISFENFPPCVFPDPQQILPYLSDMTHPSRNKEYYSSNKAYTKKCEGCSFKGKCEGIYKEYLRIYGDEELKTL